MMYYFLFSHNIENRGRHHMIMSRGLVLKATIAAVWGPGTKIHMAMYLLLF